MTWWRRAISATLSWPWLWRYGYLRVPTIRPEVSVQDGQGDQGAERVAQEPGVCCADSAVSRDQSKSENNQRNSKCRGHKHRADMVMADAGPTRNSDDRPRQAAQYQAGKQVGGERELLTVNLDHHPADRERKEDRDHHERDGEDKAGPDLTIGARCPTAFDDENPTNDHGNDQHDGGNGPGEKEVGVDFGIYVGQHEYREDELGGEQCQVGHVPAPLSSEASTANRTGGLGVGERIQRPSPRHRGRRNRRVRLGRTSPATRQAGRGRDRGGTARGYALGPRLRFG